MTTEQIEFLVNLQKIYPKRSQQISKMLHFVASLNNQNIWEQFTKELREALEADDEKSLYLLEGLVRRMKGMLSEGNTIKAKKSRKWLWISLSIALIAVLILFIL